MNKKYDLSAIIVYYQKYEFDEIKPLYETYKHNLDKTNLKYEIVFVIDGNMPNVLSEIKDISKQNDNIKIIKLGRWFGDATSLQAGFEASEGKLILTLTFFPTS